MHLLAESRSWLEDPSTAELVRRAETLVADSEAAIAWTRVVLEETRQRLQPCPTAREERPPGGTRGRWSPSRRRRRS
jgi:hypothetical protein